MTSLIELPPPGGIIALWAVVLPALYLLSTSITNLVLRDHTILKGPCPNCGTDNFTYFGDIFTGGWECVWGCVGARWGRCEALLAGETAREDCLNTGKVRLAGLLLLFRSGWGGCSG